ncbi:MAG: HAD family phosphatase [Bacteroidaceae bacterium]|nr:HAD family phosphatase [Bacteroidaceae bacterium]
MATFWTKRNEDVEDEKTANPWAEVLVKGNVQYPHRRPLKVALFDLDGTLVDTEGQYSVFWGSMGRKYRPDIPHLEQIIKGSTLTRIYDTYFPDPTVQAAITVGLDEWEASMNYDFFPGALDFIRDLKSHGVQCAVVTSSNISKMRSVMRQHPDFDALFDRVFTAEDFTASKPAPDCYLMAARAFGADLDECVVFEDAPNGLQAGMSSGIFTIGLATYSTPDAIRTLCHYVLNDFVGMTYEKLVDIMK